MHYEGIALAGDKRHPKVLSWWLLGLLIEGEKVSRWAVLALVPVRLGML
jgi:hypothetical protein